MSDFTLPRALIVIQVIFGKPLRSKREFRAGDIAELTLADLGPGNHLKPLERLVELDWVRVAVFKETETRGGRPAMYIYSRTTKGLREYRALVNRLAKYGIKLQ